MGAAKNIDITAYQEHRKKKKKKTGANKAEPTASSFRCTFGLKTQLLTFHVAQATKGTHATIFELMLDLTAI